MTTGNAAEQQFRHSFREEARELLVELESVLLELNEHGEDGELVGRVFRGLHTIKGSGAMFGFEDLATFTHNLENAFDEVRKGRLRVTPELVDLTLSALDQIRAMVEEGEGESAVDAVASTEILARLRALTGVAENAASQTAPPAEARPGTEAAPAAGEAGESAREQEWRIHFAPGPDLMRNGADPRLLVRELAEMGQLTAEASMAGLPPLEAVEPERCYVSWEMVLVSTASEDRIRDVFIFVEDSCELTITAVPAEPAARVVAAKNPARTEKTATLEPVCAGDLIAQGLEEKRRSPGRRTTDLPENATSLRVPAARLDQLVDLVGEMVTVQARLSAIAARSADGEVLEVSEEIERLTSALRENSMTLRMVPIRATFERFRRLVHDLSRDLGKNVELTIEGAETELDKTVIDQLGDPLMHLIRNSMDHGIEAPERRAAAGKRADGDDPSVGTALGSQCADRGVGRRSGHRRRRGAGPRDRARTDLSRCPAQRGGNLLLPFPARFFDRPTSDGPFRPRGGHGCGAAEGGEPAGIDRRRQPARRGHHGDAAAAADAGHYRRAAGDGGRRLLRIAAGVDAGMH